MSTADAATSPASSGVNWRRPEFILTLLGFLAFFSLPIRLTTVYEGLPAHPLLLHVPVVLIPLSIIGALVCTVRRPWFERYGVLLCLIAIVAMSSVFVTMQAGAALEGTLHLQGQAANLIHQHSSAAHVLAVAFVAFTAVLILSFAAMRISGEAGPTGLTIADRTLSSPAIAMLLRVLLVVLALVCAYYVFRVGDLGAKAVWLSRMHAAGGA